MHARLLPDTPNVLASPAASIAALGAAPATTWTIELDTAASLTAVADRLRNALGALGLEWESFTRLQALVGGIARWLQAVGGAAMQLTAAPDAVSCVLSTSSPELTVDMVFQSPLVQMLRAHLSRFEVRQGLGTLEIAFAISRS